MLRSVAATMLRRYDNRQGPLVVLWVTETGQLDGMVSKVAE